MKILKLLLIATVLFVSVNLNAQDGKASKTANLPSWLSSGSSEARFYCLPAISTFYDVQASMFIYKKAGIWVRTANLPEQYKNYDLLNGEKIIITGNINFDGSKTKYTKINFVKDTNTNMYKAGKDQIAVN